MRAIHRGNFISIFCIALLCALPHDGRSADSGKARSAVKKDYADVIAVLTKRRAAMEEFAASIERATDAKEVAAALDRDGIRYAEYMNAMRAFEKKYPELNNKARIPGALKKELDLNRAADEKVKAAISGPVYSTYREDPLVRAVCEKNLERAQPPGSGAGN